MSHCHNFIFQPKQAEVIQMMVWDSQIATLQLFNFVVKGWVQTVKAHSDNIMGDKSLFNFA